MKNHFLLPFGSFTSSGGFHSLNALKTLFLLPFGSFLNIGGVTGKRIPDLNETFYSLLGVS